MKTTLFLFELRSTIVIAVDAEYFGAVIGFILCFLAEKCLARKQEVIDLSRGTGIPTVLVRRS